MMLRLLATIAFPALVAASAGSAVIPGWPAPKSFTSGGSSVAVNASNFEFSLSSSSGKPCGTLQRAFSRYQGLTFPHRGVDASAAAVIVGLDISVGDQDESHPQLSTDESYKLNVPDGKGALRASLSAANIYGVLRGLETFSQLVTFDFDLKTYGIAAAPWTIDDAPRFPHRGLMIDTARHFETLASLRALIDSLTYSKFNVLHWHMSDTQSYPFESKTHPDLWKGSWSPQERYLQTDIADTVEYARDRGVRVIVEFDMPGHAGSWCTGYPEICPSTTCTQPLNVANEATFQLIEDVLGECTGKKTSAKDAPSGLFPDDFIHLGGDEVDTSCWTKTASVNDWLIKKNYTGDQAYAYFAKRVADIAIAQGRRPVQWSEVYDHFKTELDKKTIVHIWKSVTNVTEVVANGYQVILNVGYYANSWYLDNLNVNWTAVYANEPCTGVPDNLCPMIIGGHGEMWGETVDKSDAEQTIWPKLAAIGERLWSPRSYSDSAAALERIESFRCLLNRRGVAAAPVNNANARSSPPGPGSCYEQR